MVLSDPSECSLSDALSPSMIRHLLKQRTRDSPEDPQSVRCRTPLSPPMIRPILKRWTRDSPDCDTQDMLHP
ncbi:hypothetical protein CEXT_340251 [Caerostris extrusa]|uniref:Uncharacterized protein n=1 Tax=Caerostris extrusa TaxID=172846 RepID=A0AAV4RAV5_CAEEX|nr:hypothetical protein CEXT_340251 [Caerostris extrusa]